MLFGTRYTAILKLTVCIFFMLNLYSAKRKQNTQTAIYQKLFDIEKTVDVSSTQGSLGDKSHGSQARCID